MIIYQDIITGTDANAAIARAYVFLGEEMASDSYPMKVVDDVVYEFQAKTITIDDSGIRLRRTPTRRGADEGVADEAQRVINIVHSHRLQQTSYDKKSFMPYIKNYMKRSRPTWRPPTRIAWMPS